MTITDYWVNLAERPDVIERLKHLPEGSVLDLCSPFSESYRFLRVEGQDLVLLTKSPLGNMFVEPVEEYYPLDKILYNIEGCVEGDAFALPRHDFKVIRKDLSGHPDYEKYVRMLKG